MKMLAATLYILIIFLHTSSSNALADATSVDPNLEYKVKAAFLLNFILYTEWPPNALPSSKATVVICILGKDPFGEILGQTIVEKKHSVRNFEVRKPTLGSQSFGDCNVVFISRTENKNEEQEKDIVLSFLKSKPILTIGDSNREKSNDTIINFASVENTIQFEINLKIAEKAGIKLSSRIIPLAKKITE
jgi:hypothetical protein